MDLRRLGLGFNYRASQSTPVHLVHNQSLNELYLLVATISISEDHKEDELFKKGWCLCSLLFQLLKVSTWCQLFLCS